MGFILNKPVSLASSDSDRVQYLMDWANTTTDKLNSTLNNLSAKNFGKADAKALQDTLDADIKSLQEKLEKMGDTISEQRSMVDDLDSRVTELEGG